MIIDEIWKEFLEKIALVVNRQSFDNWFKAIKPLDATENEIRLRVPNNFFRNYIRENFLSSIKQTLKEITGTEMEVEFKLDFETTEEVENQPSLFAPPKKEERPQNSFILNPKYTFEKFVVSDSNSVAYASAVAVAKSPATAYNPLFIYGGVGLGKTHLLHAIGHFVSRNLREMKYIYVSSEAFLNDYITSLQNKTMLSFRKRYRSIDVLLMDDVQFFAGKEGVQREFFYTFNSLYETHRQLILTSDRSPKEIPTLEDRLRSRFEWGLIADIQSPNFETRKAILLKKAQDEGMSIPDDVAEFIAENIKSNIRELEGALIRLTAFASVVNRRIDREFAKEVLKNIISVSKPKKITPEIIQREVAKYFRIKTSDIKASKRTIQVAFPRQVAMFLAKEMTDLSLSEIAYEFGREHGTIIHAYRKISEYLQKESPLKEEIEHIKRTILST